MAAALTERVETLLHRLQGWLCSGLEGLEKEGIVFAADAWERPGGWGQTRTLERGGVFERAAVNFSSITGAALPTAATDRHPQLVGRAFVALGVSLILHPINPYVPCTHMNLRFLSVGAVDENPFWWFGGGYDLTPCYGFEEDCRHWHRVARDCCDAFDTSYYPKFKAACDAYFHIRHRDEPRGIGGLFFDDLNTPDFEHCLAFVAALGKSFLSAYVPIAERRLGMAYGDRQREFQLYRRGRYAEFNLVQDRGTRFGLESGGRTESILVSLPPTVSWRYDYQPEPGSEEARLYSDFLCARDWLAGGRE